MRIPRELPETPPPRVAILVQTASHWSRLVLRGVGDYVAVRGPWDVFLEPRGFYETPRLPRGWVGEGILARLSTPALARTIRRTGRPAVNVSWLGRHSMTIPKVVSDEEACGRLAAEHFLDRGFESFAFVGPLEQLGYGPALAGAFERSLAASARGCAVFTPGDVLDLADPPTEQRRGLGAWLARLTKPVGLLAWSSETGLEVAARCRALGLRVPEEVAILCVEHDELLSSLAPVPLSSIDQDPRRVGHEAAALLDRMMAGEPPPDAPILIPPVGVVQRRSTEAFAVEDPIVGEALRVIRERASTSIQVSDVARALGLSRRALEQRFRRALGRTPAREIRRVRIDRAKRLLAESDLALIDVAERTGFRHVEVLIRSFRTVTGTTPAEWRRRQVR